MGTNGCPCLNWLVLYSYKAELIQNLLHVITWEEETFCWYIDDALSVKNDHFHSYVDSLMYISVNLK
jgi:hypothetical protein